MMENQEAGKGFRREERSNISHRAVADVEGDERRPFLGHHQLYNKKAMSAASL
jgi:hypothetical protein